MTDRGLTPYLKEVGRGAKGRRDLTYQEARQAADLICDGMCTDAQLGAFLLAERVKGESADELAAFVAALRDRSQRMVPACPEAIDCAGPYDGRSHSFMATVAAGMVLAAAGVPVILHGSATLPPKQGVTVAEVLHELGLAFPADPAGASRVLVETGLVYLDTEVWCPPLARLRRVRQELGMRTLLNTAEKFLNLGGAAHTIAGVFHGAAAAAAASLVSRLGYRRAAVVQGVDGSEDVPVHRDSLLYVIQGDRVEEGRVEPAALGVAAACPRVLWGAKEQAERIRAVLRGEADWEQAMVILNAGLRLWVAGRAEDVREGVALAREALGSGRARERLAHLQAVCAAYRP